MTLRIPTLKEVETMDTKHDMAEDLQEVLVVMDNGFDLTGRKVAETVRLADDEMDTNEYLRPTMGFNVNLNKNV